MILLYQIFDTYYFVLFTAQQAFDSCSNFEYSDFTYKTYYDKLLKYDSLF